ncbi:hypothetical protein CHUAL_010861 [Chamberlinius hualienensis]
MAKKSTNGDVTLKFAHHQQFVCEGIVRLFDAKSLLDVEIECDGGVIEAHKLILGVFCPILLKSLAENHLHAKHRVNVDPVLHQVQNLGYIIEFLYRGQVTLPQLHLKELYHAAEKLELQGLLDAIKKLKGKCNFLDGHSEEADVDSRKEEEKETPCDETPSYKCSKRRKTVIKLSDTSELEDSNSDLDEKCEEPESSKPQIGLRSRLVSRANKSISRVAYKKKWRQSRPLLKCTYCEYETRDKYTFKSHMAKHDPTVGGFVCEVCSKTFRSKRGFRCHLRGHQDPGELFNCTHCNFYTPQKWSWLQHLAVIHKVDPDGKPLSETVKCSECDYVCVANHQLKAHIIRKHTVDKPFKCTECSYAAVIRYELDKHVAIVHRRERPYMCDECGFRSQTQSGFERHKRSHSGIKPFKCDICGQEYADNRKFKTHLLRHVNDEKPYVCHLCGHSCRRRDNLQMHLKRIHKTTMESEAELRSSASTSLSVATTTTTTVTTVPSTVQLSPDTTMTRNPIESFPIVNFFEVKDDFIPSKGSLQTSPSSPKNESMQL